MRPFCLAQLGGHIHNPPPGPVVLQLVGADPEADALALANAMALRDDLEARSERRVREGRQNGPRTVPNVDAQPRPTIAWRITK